MSIVNTSAQTSSLVRTSNVPASNNNAQRKNSEFWLNIGVEAQQNNEPLFISLPVGLPIDDMKPARANTSNQEWNALAQAKNGLLEELQKLAAGLQPGETLPLTLTVQLHRSAQNEAPTASENPLLAQALAALR